MILPAKVFASLILDMLFSMVAVPSNNRHPKAICFVEVSLTKTTVDACNQTMRSAICLEDAVSNKDDLGFCFLKGQDQFMENYFESQRENIFQHCEAHQLPDVTRIGGFSKCSGFRVDGTDSKMSSRWGSI